MMPSATLKLNIIVAIYSFAHLMVCQAYITSGLPAHTHRAFLRKLTDDICNTDPGSLKDVNSATKVMSAWATAPEKLVRESGKDRAIRVEGLLKRMIDERRAGNVEAVARTENYNAVMKSWAISGERSAAALRCEQILINMQDMYQSGLDSDVKPNLESFQIAIEAWTKATDEPQALKRAQQIIDWMARLYLSSANDLAKPHTSCFHPILKGWAVSGRIEAPIICENLIQYMQHLQMDEGIETAGPDTLCFNIVMSSWLKSKDVNAERNIQRVFEYMDMCHKRGNHEVKPDSASYSIAISSIAPEITNYNYTSGARRADELLASVEKGCLAGDESLRPDTIMYNQVIDYWAKTQSEKGHYLKAREVLDRQIKMHKSGVWQCRPDVTGYSSVIKACASTPRGSIDQRRAAFDLAHITFMECCKAKTVQPNDVTYGLMFKAAGRLLPNKNERNRYSKTLFSLCCSEGYLGEMAFNRLKMAVTKEVLNELTGGRSYVELPKEWRRNVKMVQPQHRKQSERKGSSNKQANKKEKQLRP